MDKISKNRLESLYSKFNKKKYVHPDPLEFLYNYDNIEDREIVALIASSLAYGRVNQILKSVKYVLDVLGPAPKKFLIDSDNKKFKKFFLNFKHRFTTGEEIFYLLLSIKNIVIEYGALVNCFKSHFSNDDENIINGLNFLSKELKKEKQLKSLIPDTLKKSACKRLNLFLRWMVRSDDVDPGGWDIIPSSKLIIPLDTHMLNFAVNYNFTKRKNSDMKTAVEITEKFKNFSPSDPVKYDFAITRFGIRNELNMSDISDFK